MKKFSQLGESRTGGSARTADRSIIPSDSRGKLKARIAQLEHENYMLKVERDLLKRVKELEKRDRQGK